MPPLSSPPTPPASATVFTSLREVAQGLQSAGEIARAAATYRLLQQRFAPDMLVLCNLALCLQSLGQDSQALESVQAALRLQPQAAIPWRVQGDLLRAMNRPGEALASYDQALARVPDDGASLLGSAHAYLALKQPELARPKLTTLLMQAPLQGLQRDEARNLLAIALLECVDQQRLQAGEAALSLVRQAELLLKEVLHSQGPNGPLSVDGLTHLADLYQRYGDNAGRARQLYEQALRIRPDAQAALRGLARLAGLLGERKLVRTLNQRLRPERLTTSKEWSGFLFPLNYDPENTPSDVFAATRGYGDFVRAKVGEPYADWPWAAANKPRLRLGFVSGDLRTHPVGFLVEGLLAALPRTGFEIFVYHNHPEQDAQTAVLRGCVDHWREVAELSDAALCELIRRDAIDVLCDMSGHTGHNRLEVFARRPAPCQFTWLGYHGGTGVPGMDAYLIDAEMAHGLEACYVEKLVDLPWAFNMAAHLLPDTRADLVQAPYERNGYVTFGSLNNPIKFNEAVFDAWAEILRRAETAVLLQRYRKFNDVGVVRAFKENFTRRGVAAERIHCLPAVTREEALVHLAQHVDLGLDPFPHGGHTTALESLAVGVPVLSMYGDRVAARVCAVFNRKLGLHDFVVDDVAAYVEQAVCLAQQPGDLAATRRLCRELTWRSPLVDSAQFAADFAQAVRQLVNGGQTTVSAHVNAASGKSRRS